MRRFSYRTVEVPLVEGDPYQRPDVMAVVKGLAEGERIVSVYSGGGSLDVRPGDRLEALIEKEEPVFSGVPFGSGAHGGRW